jgi:hypothetical protein
MQDQPQHQSPQHKQRQSNLAIQQQNAQHDRNQRPAVVQELKVLLHDGQSHAAQHKQRGQPSENLALHIHRERVATRVPLSPPPLRNRGCKANRPQH